jgi:uncharacterized membrane protein
MPPVPRQFRRRSRVRAASPYLLGGLLTATGVLHFLAPRPYAAIVPAQLPAPTGIVYASGLAELLCAAGLVVPRTRRLSGWATAALFVVVFPANVVMAVGSGSRSDVYQAGVWARLPLQIPLIAWAVSIARPTAPHPYKSIMQ